MNIIQIIGLILAWLLGLWILNFTKQQRKK